MQKRQYLKRGQTNQFPRDCIVCQVTKVMASSLIHLPRKILITKYHEQQEKTKQSAVIKELMASGQSLHAKILYRESLQQSKRLEMLQNYYTFKSIVANIKPIILQRTSKDRYESVHFFGKAYEMTVRRYLSKKLLLRGRLKQKRMEVKNGSGNSTDTDQGSMPGKFVKILKDNVSPGKDSENVTIRRLTRNLSNMVQKFSDKLSFHPSLIFDLDVVSGHVLDLTKLEKKELFRRELEDNISIIGEKKPIERLNTVGVPCEQVENIYGFKVRGKVAESRNKLKSNKSGSKRLSSKKFELKGMKENVSPNERVHTEYCHQAINEKKKSTSFKRSQKFKSPGMTRLSRGKFGSNSSATKSRVVLKKI